MRGYHPWGYFNDETSFQPEAGECYNEALSAVKGKIILCSTAGPGRYADFRHDIIRNNEDCGVGPVPPSCVHHGQGLNTETLVIATSRGRHFTFQGLRV